MPQYFSFSPPQCWGAASIMAIKPPEHNHMTGYVDSQWFSWKQKQQLKK
jgi:hypothetical protein